MNLSDLISQIEWDNWKIDDETYTDKARDEEKYWQIQEVLHCKLNWILEEENLKEESIETIKQVQQLLELINEDDL